MKKEEKVIRLFVTDEAHAALEEKSGKLAVSDYVKQELYKMTGVKQPMPPTPEQKRVLARIAGLESMVKDGLIDQSALDAAKKNAAEKYDVEFSGITADTADTDPAKADEKSEAKADEKTPAKDVSGIPKPSTQAPAHKPTTSQQKPATPAKK